MKPVPLRYETCTKGTVDLTSAVLLSACRFAKCLALRDLALRDSQWTACTSDSFAVYADIHRKRARRPLYDEMIVTSQ